MEAGRRVMTARFVSIAVWRFCGWPPSWAAKCVLVFAMRLYNKLSRLQTSPGKLHTQDSVQKSELVTWRMYRAGCRVCLSVVKNETVGALVVF
jgi:hypothetical protein